MRSGSTVPTTELQRRFAVFSSSLDARNEQRERIYKVARDITKAAKNVIFFLHRLPLIGPDSSGEALQAFLAQGDEELCAVERLVAIVAHELRNDVDAYFRFAGQYSFGLQEYVEAASFYYYLRHDALLPRDEVDVRVARAYAEYTREMEAQAADQSSAAGDDECSTPQPKADDFEDAKDTDAVKKNGGVKGKKGEDEEAATSTPPRPPPFILSDDDYLLGVSDLTGELMRFATNAMAAGRFDIPPRVRDFSRRLCWSYDVVRASRGAPRDMVKKVEVMMQSVEKCEFACYKLKVRAAEFPDVDILAHMMATDAGSSSSSVFAGGEGGGDGGIVDGDE